MQELAAALQAGARAPPPPAAVASAASLLSDPHGSYSAAPGSPAGLYSSPVRAAAADLNGGLGASGGGSGAASRLAAYAYDGGIVSPRVSLQLPSSPSRARGEAAPPLLPPTRAAPPSATEVRAAYRAALSPHGGAAPHAARASQDASPSAATAPPSELQLLRLMARTGPCWNELGHELSCRLLGALTDALAARAALPGGRLVRCSRRLLSLHLIPLACCARVAGLQHLRAIACDRVPPLHSMPRILPRKWEPSSAACLPTLRAGRLVPAARAALAVAPGGRRQRGVGAAAAATDCAAGGAAGAAAWLGRPRGALSWWCALWCDAHGGKRNGVGLP